MLGHGVSLLRIGSNIITIVRGMFGTLLLEGGGYLLQENSNSLLLEQE